MDICIKTNRKLIILGIFFILIFSLIGFILISGVSSPSEFSSPVANPESPPPSSIVDIGENFGTINSIEVESLGTECNSQGKDEDKTITCTFLEGNPKIITGDSKLDCITPGEEGSSLNVPPHIVFDYNGNIEEFSFKSCSEDKTQRILGVDVEIPANSTVHFDLLQGLSIENIVPNSKLNGPKETTFPITYSGEFFSMDGVSLSLVDLTLGDLMKIQFNPDEKNGFSTLDSPQMVIKKGGITNIIDSGTSLQIMNNVDCEAYTKNNGKKEASPTSKYLIYNLDEICVGGNSFTIISKENKFFPWMKDFPYGDITLDTNNYLSIKNGDKNFLEMKIRGDLYLNKKLSIRENKGRLNIISLDEYSKENLPDLKINEKYLFENGKFMTDKRKVIINTESPTRTILSRSSNLDKKKVEKIKKEVENKYGLSPKKYFGYMDDVREEEIVNSLLKSVQEINKKSKEIKISPAELFALSMSEGLGTCIDSDYYQDKENFEVSGFNCLGTDTFSDDFDRLTKEGLIEKDFEYFPTVDTNEKFQEVMGADFGNLENGFKALSAMIIDRKMAFKKDFIKAYGKKEYKSLTDSEKYFWTTVYFNSGMGNGRKYLTRRGKKGMEDYSKKKWNPEKENRINNLRNPRYNGLWRTATYEYIKKACIFQSYCPESILSLNTISR